MAKPKVKAEVVEWSKPEDAFRKLAASQAPQWPNYLGFYSSWLGGFFKEPWAMVIPMDDHGFHRGDGVFEAVRLHTGAYFDLQAHLKRLKNSASAIGMELPKTLPEIAQICVDLAKLCAAESGILRLYVTRGPGSFSPSPREVTGHQIYAAITKLTPPPADKYSKGVTAMFSTVEAKDPFWSQIKSCNYLQNVLMKRECLERGVDFAICLDPKGRLCEGSTENLMLLTAQGDLRVPKFDYTLRGTTVSLVLKLAEKLVAEGKIKSATVADLTRQDLIEAREAAFVGTTLGVLPIREADGTPIGGGKPGSVCEFLQGALMHEMSTSKDLRTQF